MTVTRNQFIDAWQADLRSGRYTQGKGHLCQDGKYCCLGVACETATRLGVIKHPWDGQAPEDGHPGPWFIAIFGTNNPFVRSTNPIVNRNDTDWVATLTSHNDGSGLDFDRIAGLLDQLREETRQ